MDDKKRIFQQLTDVTAKAISPIEDKSKELVDIENNLINNYGFEIVSSRIHLTYDPLFRRDKMMNILMLIEMVKKEFDISFKEPDVIDYLRQRDVEEYEINKKLIEVMIDEGLQFWDGQLKYEERQNTISVRINVISYHGQNLTVDIAGNSTEAEYIASRLMQLVCNAQNISDNNYYLKFMQTKDYETRSRQILSVSINELMRKEFRTFIEDDIESDLGKMMAGIPFDNIDTKEDDLQISVNIHEIEGRVSVYNKISGDVDNRTFRISSTNVREYGYNKYDLVSSLDSDNHIRLISRFIERLRTNP